MKSKIKPLKDEFGLFYQMSELLRCFLIDSSNKSFEFRSNSFKLIINSLLNVLITSGISVVLNESNVTLDDGINILDP